jgi:hypothetical protein
MGLRVKPAFPAPLIALTAGVSAVAILATIFAFRGPSPPPNRCTDTAARVLALHRFPDDRAAHVSKVLAYPDGSKTVIVRTDETDDPFIVRLACDAGRWRVDGPVQRTMTG